jgi:hypothetical protein
VRNHLACLNVPTGARDCFDVPRESPAIVQRRGICRPERRACGEMLQQSLRYGDLTFWKAINQLM